MDDLKRRVRVGRSHVGFGVYAARQFRPKDTIGRVHGETIHDPEHQSDYCVELSHDRGLEPAAPFRYVNHSCRPNCELVQVDVYEEDDSLVDTEMWIEAVSEIESGEQLTIDYAWPAEVAIPCRCGSPNCRGWIVAEEELPQLTGGKVDEPDENTLVL